jgi:transposase
MRTYGKVVFEGLAHPWMPLQSFLYQTFGLKDHEYLKTEYETDNVIIHIQTKADHLCCTWGKSKDVIRKGVVEHCFRTISIGLRPVFLHAGIQRLEYRSCGPTFQEKIKYSDVKKYTKILTKYALTLLYSMTITDVARHLRMSWHTIKEVDRA